MDTSSVIFIIAVTVLVTASIMYIILTRMKLVGDSNGVVKDALASTPMQLQLMKD